MLQWVSPLCAAVPHCSRATEGHFPDAPPGRKWEASWQWRLHWSVAASYGAFWLFSAASSEHSSSVGLGGRPHLPPPPPLRPPHWHDDEGLHSRSVCMWDRQCPAPAMSVDTPWEKMEWKFEMWWQLALRVVPVIKKETLLILQLEDYNYTRRQQRHLMNGKCLVSVLTLALTYSLEWSNRWLWGFTRISFPMTSGVSEAMLQQLKQTKLLVYDTIIVESINLSSIVISML